MLCQSGILAWRLMHTHHSKTCSYLVFAGIVLLLIARGGAVWADEIGTLKPQPASPSGAEYNAGASALAAGHVAEAESHFGKSLQLDAHNDGAYLGLAKVAIAKGDAKGAMLPFRKAAELATTDVGLQTSWGHYLFWQKHYAESETVLKKAIQLDPEALRPHVELGNLYLVGLHKPELAIQAYRAALKIEPKNVGVHFTLAKSLTEVGQLDQAQSELEQAAALDPKDPSMLQAIGDLQARRHNRDGALASFDKALKMQPNFVPARMARGDIFMASGDAGQALQEYQAALKSDAKFAPAYVGVGIALERQQRFDEARKAYKTAVELDPKQAVAYNNLAWIAATSKNDHDEMLGWAQKAVELAPKVATFQDTLGWVYCSRGQYDKAMVILKKAAVLAPQEPEIFYHLGVASSETGQPLEARLAFGKALALKKDFADANDARTRLAALNAQQPTHH